MICAWVITIGCYRVDPGVSPNTACLLPKSRRTQKAALFQDILESPLMAAKSKDKVCCKLKNQKTEYVVSFKKKIASCKYPGWERRTWQWGGFYGEQYLSDSDT